MPDLKADFDKAALSIDYLSPEETKELIMEQYAELGDILSEAGLNVKEQ